jgi:hypothetical protein
VLGCLAPLVVLVAAACGKDGTGASAGLSGTFSLGQINGQPLPTSFPFGINSEIIVREGQLRFLSRGRLLDIRTTQVHVLSPDQYEPATTDTAAYAYRLSGESLFVVHAAFDTAAAYTDTGTVIGGGQTIALQVRPRPGDTPADLVSGSLLYARLP